MISVYRLESPLETSNCFEKNIYLRLDELGTENKGGFVAPLKLRPYGAIQICLLLLYYYY